MSSAPIGTASSHRVALSRRLTEGCSTTSCGAALQFWAATSTSATRAATFALPTTLVAIATVRSVRVPPKAAG